MQRKTVALLLTVTAAAACCSAAGSGAAPPPTSTSGPLRVWIEEYAFAEGETELLREAVGGSGGAAVVAGETRSRSFLAPKGYQRLGRLDLLWTGREGCNDAFKRTLNATHLVSCVPGTQAITDKALLGESLSLAYGEGALGLAPRSFRLPSQYFQLARWLKQAPAGGDSHWALKRDVHRGEGVSVVPVGEALARALARCERGQACYVVAQQFMTQQYLVQRRPFYIRVWVVLVGTQPARAYLWDGGVVVFGQQQAQRHTHSGTQPQSLVVNLWKQDRQAADPWSMQRLRQHLDSTTGSGAAFEQLWQRAQTVLAAALAAALPAARRSAAALPGYQGGAFEVLGADLVVDAQLRPWLIEVNWLPSLARKVLVCDASGAGTACQLDNPFDQQKAAFVRGLVQLLVAMRAARGRAQAQAAHLLQQAGVQLGQQACVTASELEQLLGMRHEDEVAEAQGFLVLTPVLYEALACIAGGPGSATCALLPPPPAAEQCSSSSSRNSAGSWGAVQRVLQRPAAWLPAIDLAAAVQRQPSLHPGPVGSVADRRLRSWLESNRSIVDAASLLEFCAEEQR